MERETRILALVFFALLLVAVLMTVGGRVRRELAPEPQAAWVAIAATGRPAVSGPVELTVGESFRLHAVLEAEDWRGERLYYTDAEALVLAGEEVPADALRRWTGADEVRLLWFTVEGGPPYLEMAEAGDLERLQFRELFRAEWPQAWTVPGSVEPSRRRLEAGRLEPAIGEFGSQSYHVRIEFFDAANRVLPRLRMRSWGAQEILEMSDRFPTVTVRLPGPLAVSSGVFGTPQVEPLPGADAALRGELAGLWQRRLAFSRLFLLRDVLDRAGRSWERLGWRAVALDAGPAWGPDGASPGDLLRVGERFVILVADEGIDGRLDYDDLVFDFGKGAALRRMTEVFTGEGLVEWAPLGS